MCVCVERGVEGSSRCVIQHHGQRQSVEEGGVEGVITSIRHLRLFFCFVIFFLFFLSSRTNQIGDIVFFPLVLKITVVVMIIVIVMS